MQLVLLVLSLVLLPFGARAGGTLAMADLLPLLKQKPQLSGFLFHSYGLPSSAFAQIRLGSHFRHLGGKRLGPYLLEAQTRVGRPAGKALITLCTRHRFLDSAGAVLPVDADQHVLANGAPPPQPTPPMPARRLALQRLDQDLFDAVADAARRAPRRRRNHNLHGEADLVQRFLNVLQPGTYVRPHCHRREIPGTGFECFVVLQGAIGLLLFDASGQLRQRERLDAAGPLRGIELAEGEIHSLVALAADSVMLEIKQGPYRPSTDKDFLPQFPAEGTAAAAELVQRWTAAFT